MFWKLCFGNHVSDSFINQAWETMLDPPCLKYINSINMTFTKWTFQQGVSSQKDGLNWFITLTIELQGKGRGPGRTLKMTWDAKPFSSRAEKEKN